MSLQPEERYRPAESNIIFKAANGLTLAASPVFAAMALITLRQGDPPEMLCASIGAPWNGMATMYLLMCVGHLPPWLRLLARHRASKSGHSTRQSPELLKGA